MGDVWEGEVMEGAICACGKMEAHYDVCPTCDGKVRADRRVKKEKVK